MPVLKYRARIFKNPEEIQGLIHGMADDILGYHADDLGRHADITPVYMVPLLEGAKKLGYDLIRAIREIQPERDMVVVPITAKSYAGTVSTGKVDIGDNINLSALDGKDVWIVDDVADSRITLDEVEKHLGNYGIRSIRRAVLVDKPDNKMRNVDVDVVGVTVPGELWIAGYGIDRDGYFRKNPNLVVTEDVREPFPGKIKTV